MANINIFITAVLIALIYLSIQSIMNISYLYVKSS